MSEHDNEILKTEVAESPERRAFLKKAGRFAVVTPAAAAVLLSTSMNADARVVGSMGDKYYKKAHTLKKIQKLKKAKRAKYAKRLQKVLSKYS